MIAWLGSALFPQRVGCAVCGNSLDQGFLCERCAASLLRQRLEKPRSSENPHAYAAFRYADVAQTLVRALKYNANQTAALPLTDGMLAVWAANEALRQADALTFVPMYPARQRERGYNQAQRLCECFAGRSGLAVVSGALKRVRQNESQVEAGREERLRNVRGAFAVTNASVISGRRVLLIDDVYTTGATAQACTEALLASGAASVRILTACRVEKE